MKDADTNTLDQQRLGLELQKLKLDRQRIAIDARLKRKEQELQRKQVEANVKGGGKWSQIFSPVGAAVLAGLVGLFGTVLNGFNNTSLERQKQQGTLILEAIKTSGLAEQKEQQTAANLVFLADAGLIEISKPELAKLRTKAGGNLPSLPPINSSNVADTTYAFAVTEGEDILITITPVQTGNFSTLALDGQSLAPISTNPLTYKFKISKKAGQMHFLAIECDFPGNPTSNAHYEFTISHSNIPISSFVVTKSDQDHSRLLRLKVS
jgi:hypothetical protein